MLKRGDANRIAKTHKADIELFVEAAIEKGLLKKVSE